MGRVRLEYEQEYGGDSRKYSLPFTVAVLADLSGHNEPDEKPRFLSVDRDNIDNVLEKISPTLSIKVPDRMRTQGREVKVDLVFSSLKSFEPENVLRQVPELLALLTVRNALASISGKTSPDESLDVGALLDNSTESPAHMLDRLVLDRRVRDAAFFEGRWETVSDRLLGLLDPDQKAIGNAPTTHAQNLIRSIDAALTDQLSEILDHAEFRGLEATWAGLAYLTSLFDSSHDDVRLRVLNLSKRALRQDIGETEESNESVLRAALLAEFTFYGGEPVSLIIGAYEFDKHAEDVDLLDAMARLACFVTAPFVSAAAPELFLFDRWSELNLPRVLSKLFGTAEHSAWRDLRSEEHARFVGLALPRVLLERKYVGAETRIETFRFEKKNESDPSRALWGNPAFAFAELAITNFVRFGWHAWMAGVENGLANVADSYRVKNSDGIGVKLGPTEISIPGSREAEIVDLGFLPFCSFSATSQVALLHTPAVLRPPRSDRFEFSAASTFESRLNYLMPLCTVAQHLQCMVRDSAFRLRSRTELQESLSKWLANYVSDDAEKADVYQYPFAYIGIKLLPEDGKELQIDEWNDWEIESPLLAEVHASIRSAGGIESPEITLKFDLGISAS